MEDPNTEYSVSLSVAQWDLVLCSLGYMYERADPDHSAVGVVDKFCRMMTRRRLREVMAEIKSAVPEAATIE